MNLLSLEYFLFFFMVLVVYYLIPGKGQWICLLAASIAFYLLADVRYILFLAFSLATSYGAARCIPGQSRKKKKAVLAVALVLNLGCLVFLKYYDCAASLLGGLGLSLPLFRLVMPLGISYYTLTVVGYCIDVYREKIKPERNFLKYALFVSFFPQIVQGPIPRYDHLAKQLVEPHRFEYKNLAHGLQLVLWGLFKKMVIADWCGVAVTTVFDGETYIGSQVILATFFFTIQLYTDFSGCVDIVRGCAECFGIRLGENFARPYFAMSIQDFWHRWHISLSTWLRDYVYIPLGGSRKGTMRRYLNILLTFLVSGIWHGVGLQFVAWGLLHGIYQVAGSLLKPLRDKFIDFTGTDRTTVGYRILQTVLTFGMVAFAWLFFRAPSIEAAVEMLMAIPMNFRSEYLIGNRLLTIGLDAAHLVMLAAAMLVLLAVSLLQEKGEIREMLDKQPLLIRWAVYLAGIAIVIVFGYYGPSIEPNAFIYAQF